ncbi:MAG: DUF3231 family protein [Firmicutes bacterium]|nr:DUF3231 family protein [Bacillota bacterium]
MSEKKDRIALTSAEISGMWASYIKNNMELRFFEYFVDIVESDRIKEILISKINRAKQSMFMIENIFKEEFIPLPNGFISEDVKADAPRVISDEFIAAFCYDFILLTIHTYTSALLDSTRKDIRDYFQDNISYNISMQDDVIEYMIEKGIYPKHPNIAIEKDIILVDNKKYLGRLIGDNRPLNISEISALARIIFRAQFSKMVFVVFSKTAKSKELKEHFNDGVKEIQKVVDSLQPVLSKENINISSTGEYKIFDTDESPFSEKIMLYFINTCIGMYCFNMIGQSLTASLRNDINGKSLIIMKDMLEYYNKGIKIMVKNGWLEAPPQPIDMSI